MLLGKLSFFFWLSLVLGHSTSFEGRNYRPSAQRFKKNKDFRNNLATKNGLIKKNAAKVIEQQIDIVDQNFGQGNRVKTTSKDNLSLGSHDKRKLIDFKKRDSTDTSTDDRIAEIEDEENQENYSYQTGQLNEKAELAIENQIPRLSIGSNDEMDLIPTTISRQERRAGKRHYHLKSSPNLLKSIHSPNVPDLADILLLKSKKSYLERMKSLNSQSKMNKKLQTLRKRREHTNSLTKEIGMGFAAPPFNGPAKSVKPEDKVKMNSESVILMKPQFDVNLALQRNDGHLMSVDGVATHNEDVIGSNSGILDLTNSNDNNVGLGLIGKYVSLIRNSDNKNLVNLTSNGNGYAIDGRVLANRLSTEGSDDNSLLHDNLNLRKLPVRSMQIMNTKTYQPVRMIGDPNDNNAANFVLNEKDSKNVSGYVKAFKSVSPSVSPSEGKHQGIQDSVLSEVVNLLSSVEFKQGMSKKGPVDQQTDLINNEMSFPAISKKESDSMSQKLIYPKEGNGRILMNGKILLPEESNAKLGLTTEEKDLTEGKSGLPKKENDSLDSKLEQPNEENDSIDSKLELQNEENNSIDKKLVLSKEGNDSIDSKWKMPNEENDSIDSKLEVPNEENDSMDSKLDMSNEENDSMESKLEMPKEENDSMNRKLSKETLNEHSSVDDEDLQAGKNVVNKKWKQPKASYGKHKLSKEESVLGGDLIETKLQSGLKSKKSSTETFNVESLETLDSEKKTAKKPKRNNIRHGERRGQYGHVDDNNSKIAVAPWMDVVRICKSYETEKDNCTLVTEHTTTTFRPYITPHWDFPHLVVVKKEPHLIGALRELKPQTHERIIYDLSRGSVIVPTFTILFASTAHLAMSVVCCPG